MEFIFSTCKSFFATFMNRSIRIYCFGTNPLQALRDRKTNRKEWKCCLGWGVRIETHVTMLSWSRFILLSYLTQSVTSMSEPEPELEKQWNSLETVTELKSQSYSSLPSWQSCLNNNRQVFIGKAVYHVYLPSQRKWPGIHFSFSLLKSFIVRIWFLFSFLHWNSDDLQPVVSRIDWWRPGHALDPF